MIVNTDGHDISKLIQRIKMNFGTYFRNKIGIPSGSVWRNGLWDHIIRDEEDLRYQVDYIHFNPVNTVMSTLLSKWEYPFVFQYCPKRDWKFDLSLIEKFKSGEFGE